MGYHRRVEVDPWAELVRAGQAAWPELSLDEGVFRAHLLARRPAPTEVSEADCARAAELYLTCACQEGDKRAIALLEARYFDVLPGLLRKLDLPAATIDEAVQLVRIRLLAPPEGQPAKIADYRGAGDLRSWLRVMTAREAIHLLHKTKKTVPLDDQWLGALPAAADDPELAHVKAKYLDAFQLVLRETVAALTARQRLLLRQHFIFGLSAEQIGAVYGVHRVTAHRWLTEARERLRAQTAEKLQARLGLEGEELQSVVRLVQSQLDVSLRTYLPEEAEEAEEHDD
jgi:RNA polymerase sigma-70 factor (ECF subfamily)